MHDETTHKPIVCCGPTKKRKVKKKNLPDGWTAKPAPDALHADPAAPEPAELDANLAAQEPAPAALDEDPTDQKLSRPISQKK